MATKGQPISTEYVQLLGGSSGHINLKAPTAPTSYDFTFPSDAGTLGWMLQSGGDGSTSWTNTPTFSYATFSAIQISGQSSGIINIQGPVAAGDYTQIYFLPTGPPTTNQLLSGSIDGGGVSNLSWVDAFNPASPGTIGNTTPGNITGLVITANTNFAGNLTGNVTGNVSGSSGSCTGNAATATSATSAGTATNFSGSLTGDVIGTQGATVIDTGKVTNSMLAGSIAYSKLSLTGAILNADLAGSIAYSKLSLTGAILNADLAGSISYSKLSLTGAILNADLAGSIAYSKLSLTGAILNADLAGSIADSKLSTISTAGKVSDTALSANVALLNGAQTFSAANIFNIAGAASTPGIKTTGTPFSGTGTTSFPQLFMQSGSPTAVTDWNTSGTLFGANTSSSSQYYIDFRRNGSSQSGGGTFSVDNNASIQFSGTINATSWNLKSSGASAITISSLNKFQFIGAGATSGSAIDFLFTTPADSGLTASTNVPHVKFNFAAVQTHLDGAITEQDFFLITQPTINGTSGASTVVSDLSTFTIANAPAVGANASATRSMALWIQAGLARFDGSVQVASLAGVVSGAAGLLSATANGSANQVFGMTNAGTGYEYKTITAGSNITVTHAANSITITSSASVGSAWNSITDPTGNLSLAMSTRTSTWTWGNATSSSNLWTLTDATTNSSASGYFISLVATTGSTIKGISSSMLGAVAGDFKNSSPTIPPVQMHQADTTNLAPILSLMDSTTNIAFQFRRGSTQGGSSNGAELAFKNTGAQTGDYGRIYYDNNTSYGTSNNFYLDSSTSGRLVLQSGGVNHAYVGSAGFVGIQNSSTIPALTGTNADTAGILLELNYTTTPNLRVLKNSGNNGTSVNFYNPGVGTGTIYGQLRYDADGVNNFHYCVPTGQRHQFEVISGTEVARIDVNGMSVAAANAFTVVGRSKFSSSADGLIELLNNAGSGFTRLNLGGATSSFPAIKVNGAAINFVLGDGTGNAAVTTGNLTIGGGAAILKVLTNTATLDFGSTAPGAVTDLTITVTGAALGDVVILGVPNGSTVAAGDFTAWVSATNTVTVRFANNQLVGSLDPASGTFRATVLQH